jgi:hypothetical protein
MAVMLVNYSFIAGTDKKQNDVLEEVIALCKRIIAESGDTVLAKDALNFSDTTSKFNVVSMFVTVRLQRFYGWFYMPDSRRSLNVA